MPKDRNWSLYKPKCSLHKIFWLILYTGSHLRAPPKTKLGLAIPLFLGPFYEEMYFYFLYQIDFSTLFWNIEQVTEWHSGLKDILSHLTSVHFCQALVQVSSKSLNFKVYLKVLVHLGKYVMYSGGNYFLIFCFALAISTRIILRNTSKRYVL